MYRPLPVPTRFERHVLSRFTFGYTPELLSDLRRAGGPYAWFDRQLDAFSIPDPKGDAALAGFDRMGMSAPEIMALPYRNPAPSHQDAASNVVRRALSSRQVHEVMHDFWRNLFYVSVAGASADPFLPSFDAGMRRRALTNFPSLLRYATAHPAMRTFLSSYNVGAGNENHPRELLELHTLGTGKYTEADVKSVAKLFTGWAYHANGRPRYEPGGRVLGPVRVLGFYSANSDPARGPQVLAQFLTHLANLPATRYAVCRRLAKRFVSERPPHSLVVKLTRTWARTDGDVRAILRTLVRSEEFRASVDKPIAKSPQYDYIGAIRHKLVSAGSGNALHLVSVMYWYTDVLGDADHGVYGWFMPNGYGEDVSRWATPSVLLSSTRFHRALLTGRREYGSPFELDGCVVREVRDFWPRGAAVVTVSQLVDHLCRRVWGRAPSRREIWQIASSAGLLTSESVSADMPESTFWWLLSGVFDAPQWLVR